MALPPRRIFSPTTRTWVIWEKKKKFIVVFPQGIDNAFNAGGCCADTHNLDDEQFARAIVENVARENCVDLDQVFATGWSNGAYMSFYLACRASDIFSAIAPVGGLIGIDPWDDCIPENPPRILMFHEILDPDVDYCGAYPEYTGAEELVALFAEKQGCSADKVGISYENGEVICRSHLNCPAGKNATLCTITRSYPSHSWPGAESDVASEIGTQDIQGTEQIWSFFAQEYPPSDDNLVCDSSPASDCPVNVYNNPNNCEYAEKVATDVPTEGLTMIDEITMFPSNVSTMVPSEELTLYVEDIDAE